MLLKVKVSLPWTLFTILFGLCIGSLLNVVIYRLPRGESIVTPRSHCPPCGHSIRWYDNIPLLSFLLLKGHCRSCQKPISWQYPLVELLTGCLSFLVFKKFGGIPYFLYFLLLVCPLIAITFIDLKHQIIPNWISLPGIGAGLLTSCLLSGSRLETIVQCWWGIMAGGGALFLVSWLYEKIRKKEGIGMGDVKLAAMLGAFFGWKGVFFILLLSSLLGSIAGFFLILFFRKGFQDALPYGPFLAGAALIQLFFGSELISLYLQFTQRLY